MDDGKYMQQAITLAANGLGWVSPNPPVGCVIVQDDGRVVGEGWHQRYGEAHAEVNALTQAGSSAAGATAYVTLMPCNHYGKTPPCTQALIKAGIRRVVVAVDDPDPVSGEGLATLKEAGVKVEVGLLGEKALKVMHGFVKYLRSGLPHITLKYAMTLDGCIATAEGDSKWISSVESRDLVQQLRSESDAVLVGSRTMLQDNPRLNVRDHTRSQPFRVIVDSNLLTSPNSCIFSTSGGKVILLTGTDAAAERVTLLQRAGAEVIKIPRCDGYLDLRVGLQQLAEVFGVRSILCEGGGGLAGVLLREGLVDRVITFIAPKILGGNGIPPTRGETPELMSEAIQLEDFESMPLSGDVVCSGWIKGSLEF